MFLNDKHLLQMISMFAVTGVFEFVRGPIKKNITSIKYDHETTIVIFIIPGTIGKFFGFAILAADWKDLSP